MAGDGDLDRLEAWAGEAGAQAMAEARARTRWLRLQADEQTRLRSVLADLSERGTPAAVTSASGRTHHGCIETPGHDFTAVRTAAGRVLVALDAVVAVRAAGGTASSGDRAGAEDGPPEGAMEDGARLAEELADLAPTRRRVQLIARGGHAVTGELRSVGADVAVVRVDGEPEATVYVSLGSIAEVVLLISG